MSKPNDYGVAPRYQPGDRVRIWAVFKNPVGTIEKISDEESFPIKYLVAYSYPDTGMYYREEFEACDLTLYEKMRDYGCNCNTQGGMHTTWCNCFTRKK